MAFGFIFAFRQITSSVSDGLSESELIAALVAQCEVKQKQSETERLVVRNAFVAFPSCSFNISPCASPFSVLQFVLALTWGPNLFGEFLFFLTNVETSRAVSLRTQPLFGLHSEKF